jgi:hypothetical protein
LPAYFDYLQTFTIREKRENKVGWEKAKYEALCRGEQQTPRITRNMKCRYNQGGNPYLRISPVKEELIFEKPKILIYHDIISDKEIEIVKRLARPKVLENVNFFSQKMKMMHFFAV